MADESTRFIGGPLHPAAAWRSMATMVGAWTLEGFSMFSVIEKTTGRWVGAAWPLAAARVAGNRGWLGLGARGPSKGYATEGATIAIDWAFETLGWTEVIHSIDADNINSIALAERLGSRRLRSAVLPPPLDWHVRDLRAEPR